MKRMPRINSSAIPSKELEPNQNNKPLLVMRQDKKAQSNWFVRKEQVLRKRMSHARTIEFKNLKCRELGKVIKGWKPYKTIQELALDFEGYYDGISDQMWKEICSEFKRYACLKSLRFNLILNRNLFHNGGGEDLSEGLKRIVTLERLSLCLTIFNNLDAGILKCLEKGLRGLPLFHHLDLKLICNEVSEATFELFGRFLASLRHLKELDLNFSNCRGMNSVSIVSLGEELGKASNLQRLHLTFEICKSIGKASFEKLHDKIKEMSSLKSFKILIKSPGKSFGECRKPLLYLENLIFELSKPECSEIQQETLQLNFEKSITWIGNLNSQKPSDKLPRPRQSNLDLLRGQFQRYNFNVRFLLSEKESTYNVAPIVQDALEKILFDEPSNQHQESKSLKNLRKLRLNFSNCGNLSDPPLLPLKKDIQQLTALEVLDIDLSSCTYVAFEGFRTLIEECQKLDQLQSLTMSLARNGTYWKQINETFENQLNLYLESLKKIEESIAKMNNLNESARSGCLRGLANLVDRLTNFKNLMPLKKQKDVLKYHDKIDKIPIIMKFNERIIVRPSNSQASSLLQAFSRFGLKRSPVFNEAEFLAQIQELEKILKETGDSIGEAVEEVIGFKSLEKLCLNFEENAIFDDEEAEYLSRIIKRTSSLQEIDLNFSKCQGITTFGVESLSQALKSLKKLKSLNLNLEGCSEGLTRDFCFLRLI